MRKSTRDLNKNGTTINQMNKLLTITFIAIITLTLLLVSKCKDSNIQIDTNGVDINKAITSGGLTIDK